MLAVRRGHSMKRSSSQNLARLLQFLGLMAEQRRATERFAVDVAAVVPTTFTLPHVSCTNWHPCPQLQQGVSTNQGTHKGGSKRFTTFAAQPPWNTGQSLTTPAFLGVAVSSSEVCRVKQGISTPEPQAPMNITRLLVLRLCNRQCIATICFGAAASWLSEFGFPECANGA
eukprot:gnl/MRDRNA2_/MRDRNA2_84352_c0_seq2.p1 gnl/MRDRNA2_/MRDRNA2_84352_c0~~gnl/MRDRNA2_/MRDRNA2_84352_c0_seq2.p1  ORF type:complete len:171 (+),score=1.53 gnl/MRDRNA2_/MRDRNA2_84352_c0_seq2:152-664(+)